MPTHVTREIREIREIDKELGCPSAPLKPVVVLPRDRTLLR